MKIFNLNYATIYADVFQNILGVIMHKICSICNKRKSLDLFYKRHKGCKECWNLKRRMSHPPSVCRHCKIEFHPGVEGRYKFCSEQCRFLNKIIKDEKSGCWIWQSRKNKTGYGCFVEIGKKNGLAHRAAYRIFKGPIKNDLNVLHSCHNPSCVAPDHLRLGTPMDNTNDRRNAGRTNAKPYTILNIKKMKKILVSGA